MLDTIITQTGQAEPFAPATLQKARACRTITSDKPQHNNTAILPPGNKFSLKLTAKPKGPVRKNTFGYAVAAPTDKRGFVTPEFPGCWFTSACMVYGRGGVYPQGRPHGVSRVLNHHVHPLRVRTRWVGSKSRYGALTMPQAFAPVRLAAPAIASNDAISPTTTDAVRLHLLACNGLAEALHVLRHGDLSPEAMHRAIGRAIRGTTALKRLAAMEGVAA